MDTIVRLGSAIFALALLSGCGVASDRLSTRRTQVCGSGT